MKKRIFVALLAVVAIFCMAFALVGCNTNINYKLYFRVDGEVYAVIDTSGDEVISIPADPVKDGYTFAGWFWDENVWEKPFTANSLLDAPISGNMSVYAKFSIAHPHVPADNWSYDAQSHWKACTCGEKLQLSAHNWTAWTAEQPASGESARYEVRTCTVCGQSEQRLIGQSQQDNDKQNYDMSGVRFSGSSVTYDGQAHSIFVEGQLPVGVSVSYENNGRTAAGEYYVTAQFTGDTATHNPIPSMTAKLTILKAKLNMTNVIFADQTVKFDGAMHSLTVQNLPNGLSAEDIVYYYNGQPADGVVAPGVYTVIATFAQLDNYESVENITATLTITQDSHADKYEQYNVLGKTIDLIHADSINTTVSGGKSVFNDNLTSLDVYRQDLGKQEGTSYWSENISEAMEKFSASIDAKVSFGAKNGKSGGFLSNKLPSFNISASGSYTKTKKSETSTISYMYSYLMDGFRVDIEGYRDPSRFTGMISDELIADAEKVRNGSLSPEGFIEMWGTHVIMSAIYGERVDVSYTAMAHKDGSSQESEAKIAAGLQACFLNIIEGDVSVSVNAGDFTTESTSNKIQSLQINVTSKNVLAATDMTEFAKRFPEWQKGDHSQYAVFADVPDDSLYCIWYLLGDEYRDVINILDAYMYSQCSELYNSRLNAIYSFMLANDFEFDSAEQVLTLNLDVYQELGEASKFDAINNFDKSTNVLSIYPAIDGISIKKIVINGAYYLDNRNGQQITTLIDNFSLRFVDGSWAQDLEIVLNNVGIRAGNDMSAFDFSQLTKELNVVFTINGVNEIRAGSGTSAGSGINGEGLNFLIQSFDPDSKLTIYGGNGSDGVDVGEDGQNGGIAIIANNLTVNTAGTLSVYGGQGGNGAMGKDSNVQGNTGRTRNWIWQENAGNGGQGGQGGKGGNGGNGGDSMVGTVYVEAGSCFFAGGQGGNGGQGGKGGKGGQGGGNTAWGGGTGNGGKGGRGGTGGNAGRGGTNVSLKYTASPYADLEVQNGKHGEVGSGGLGGDPGDPGVANNLCGGGGMPGKRGDAGDSGQIPE